MNAVQVAGILSVEYRLVINLIRRGALRAECLGIDLTRRGPGGLWIGPYTITDNDLAEFLRTRGYLYNWRGVYQEPWKTIAREANEPDPYINIKEVCCIVGYTEAPIRRRILRWSVPAVIDMRGAWWVRRSDAEMLRDRDRGLAS